MLLSCINSTLVAKIKPFYIYYIIKSPFECVQIRQKYIKDGELRYSTYKGISLKSDQFTSFTLLSEVMGSFHPQITEAVPYSQRPDHTDWRVMSTCTECNPFRWWTAVRKMDMICNDIWGHLKWNIIYIYTCHCNKTFFIYSHVWIKSNADIRIQNFYKNVFKSQWCFAILIDCIRYIYIICTSQLKITIWYGLKCIYKYPRKTTIVPSPNYDLRRWA